MKKQVWLLALGLYSSFLIETSLSISTVFGADCENTDSKWAYQSKGLTVVRGGTFVNTKTISGPEAAMIEVDGKKIIFEHNRMYNMGNIIGKDKASMVNYKTKNRYRQISSRNNLFYNAGKVIGVK